VRINIPACPTVILKGKHTIIWTGPSLPKVLILALWKYARLKIRCWWFWAAKKREQSREFPAEL